jgi:predicted outer membrane repeat protein
MKPQVITLLTVGLAFSALPVLAVTWNVPGDAGTIAGGLALASAGDTVLVACGTYFESGLTVPGGVVLRSATGDPSCVTIDGTGTRGTVIQMWFAASSTRVEGFTITGGSSSNGAGMMCFGSSATVSDCNFNGNSATNRGGGVYIEGQEYYYNDMDFVDCNFNGNTANEGAAAFHNGPHSSSGIYNSSNFVGCTFDQNTASSSGGGVFGYYCGHDFTDCTFTGNAATTGSGGGVYSQYAYYDDTDFSGCTFSGNTADDFGGGVCFEYTAYYNNYDFAGCTFSGNSATDGGGFAYSYNNYDYQDLNFSDCTFSGNTATSYGGGVYCYYSDFDFSGCTFDANSATYTGGGVYTEESANAYFTSSDFTGNTANSGGGYGSTYDAYTVFQGSTFDANSATNDGGGAYSSDGAYAYYYSSDFIGNTATNGGAVYASYGHWEVMNSTLYGNSATLGGGLYTNDGYGYISHSIFSFSPSGEAIYCDNSSDSYIPSLWCTDIYGNAGGDWVGCIADQYSSSGNISEDPMFCCAPRGNLRIDHWSPCQACSEGGGNLIGNHGTGCRGNRCEHWNSRDALASVLMEQLGGGAEFRVLSPAPNPFNPSTEIAYSIPAGAEPSRVTMKVYDAAGRAVVTLVDEDLGGGMYSAVWNGRDRNGIEVASGVYFYRTTWNGQSETLRMVLLK